MSAQQFLAMTVAAGKARQRNLPPGVLIVRDYCDPCGQQTEHESRERLGERGQRYEDLTCTECGNSQSVQIL